MSLNIDPQHYRNHRYDWVQTILHKLCMVVLLVILCVISAMFKGCDPTPEIIAQPAPVPAYVTCPAEYHTLSPNKP